MKFRRWALLAGAALVVLAVGLSWKAALPKPQPNPLASNTPAHHSPAGRPPAAAVAPGLPPPHSHAHHSAQATPLPAPRMPGAAWQATQPEPVLAAFHQWTQQYLAADASRRAGLLPEGVELARARLATLARLIQEDPERALARALPPGVRAQLPAEIQPHLEQPVNTLARYELLCVLPTEPAATRHEGLYRTALIGPDSYRVFTYGRGLDYVTRDQAPVQGIAVPRAAAAAPLLEPLPPTDFLMALDPNPARFLDAGELADYRAAAGESAICAATGEPWTARGTPAALLLGGSVVPLAQPGLAAGWLATNPATAHLDEPQPPGNLPTAASSYTEGRKRFILFRVDFPDYAGEVMTTNQALTLMSGMSNFLAEISYGKLIIAAVGDGSDITPTMRLPNEVESYQNMGTLLGACRNAATALGYDMNRYDFYFVCTAGRPSATFAGLGYVGGVGFWLANRYWDVRTGAHEYGHNLGLGHANWWNTGGASMLGAGTSDEYGDDFDTMGGSGGGSRHFSSFSKNKLNWIADADCPTITTSGSFRLYAHDDLRASGVRGLRFRRTGGDYWMEFRQRFTGNRALMNGLSFRWVGGSTTLLDATPGSASGKDDHPLVIGRTFSDRKLGLHVTPVGKGSTYPESLDLVVNVGAFPNNRPPQARVLASTLTAAVNEPVSFSAAATDPEGDALAYYWDFGNGAYSVDNLPAATQSFGSAGEYTVHCLVSDMKGGVGVGSAVVRVGNPSTFRIAGRVLTTNAQPVAGMMVRVNASRYAFTRSDGSFTLSQLGAGSYTLNVLEPFYNEINFANPFFSNPVTVGPSYNGADFIQFPGSLYVTTSLVAKEDRWRYLDDGSNQGTAWISAGFDDSSWSAGNGIFGYGQGGERTVLSFGGDSNNKHITCYFRKTFTNHTATAFTNLVLEVLRDDGVLVYLNGNEIFRDNLPAGTITHTTRAVAAVEPDNYLRATLSPSLLQSGVNQLAVEVHQVEQTSSDLYFDLALSGVTLTNTSDLAYVYFSSPAEGAVFTYPTNISLAVSAQSGGAAVSQVRIYTDGQLLIADSIPPYTGLWPLAPVGQHTLTAVAVLANGLNLTSAPVTIDVRLPEPPPPAPLQVSLITTGALWQFFAGPTGAPPDWAALDFNTAGWSNGLAELGYGENDEATRVSFGPNSNDKWITAYFRHAFVVPDPYSVTGVVLQLKRDDGAVVYLNGQEILRDLMPEGPVAYNTFATQAADDDGKTFFSFSLPNLALQPGTNLLAVEIHQNSVTSSDMSFDLGLSAWVSTNRARGVYLAAPAPGSTLSAGDALLLQAEPVSGSGPPFTRVAFFINQQFAAETAAPFTLTWPNPPVGMVEITAVAADATGGSVTSAPVQAYLTAPSLVSSLIAFQEVWKYWDDRAFPGAAWMQPVFNDTSWKAGAARLGYGGDGERTVISDGGDTSFRNITAYFRKSFIASLAGVESVRLRLICDDGAAVYLNGQEVFRHNLKPGLISPNSLALAAVSGAAETTPIEVRLNPALLLHGTNWIAVEVHQNSITSSDLGFDLELTTQRAPFPGAAMVYLTAPAAGARLVSPPVVNLTTFAMAGEQGARQVEYFANGVNLGAAQAYPYLRPWPAPAAGAYSVVAVAQFDGGIIVTSAPVSLTVTPTPPPVQPTSAVWIPAGSMWRFWDNVSPVLAGWQEQEFNDDNWPLGQARFGWGFDGEKTELTSGRVTHYFRRAFVVPDPVLFTEMIFQLARDDGAVVYFNGREVFRSNMPQGPITAATLASTTVNTPDETTYFETIVPILGAGLRAGTNVVAVELHQSSATSNDGGFDLQLLARGTTEPRLYFLHPQPGQTLVFGQPIALEAQAWTGAALTSANIEFLANGIKIGQSLPGATRWEWTDAPLGDCTLTARLTLAGGAELLSPPVPVTIQYPPFASSLIATGTVWRYWDRGSLPATNWHQRGYHDSAWSFGAARFGYGGDGERTVLQFGTANNKYPAYYFRRWFEAPANATLTRLTFRLLRDDGAVVYLNGGEVFRSNMPEGPITYNTLALSAVTDSGEQTYYETLVPVAALLPGPNLIAVEIHQNSVTSSDLSFDLGLEGGGFLGGPAFAAVPPPQINAGHLDLAWPTNMHGWQLFSSPRLGPDAQWLPVTGLLLQTNGLNLLRVAPTGASLYYRLELR